MTLRRNNPHRIEITWIVHTIQSTPVYTKLCNQMMNNIQSSVLQQVSATMSMLQNCKRNKTFKNLSQKDFKERYGTSFIWNTIQSYTNNKGL